MEDKKLGPFPDIGKALRFYFLQIKHSRESCILLFSKQFKRKQIIKTDKMHVESNNLISQFKNIISHPPRTMPESRLEAVVVSP